MRVIDQERIIKSFFVTANEEVFTADEKRELQEYSNQCKDHKKRI